MNTALINLSDDEITEKFAEAVAKAKSGDFDDFAALMADFNALQRPDDDPLKIALTKQGGMLMSGQAEALSTHKETRQSIALMMEWTQDISNVKYTKAQLTTSLQGVAWYFLHNKTLGEFKKLINSVKEYREIDMEKMVEGLSSDEFQSVARQVLPANIAEKAVENREAKRSKSRAPRKKKSE